MSRRFSRRRREDGAVLVLVAVALPALALLAAFAIDVAHWYDYSRNLQLRADAAALAGGDQFGGVCAPSSPDPAAMSAVGKMAQLYSGPPGAASDLYYPYSGVGSPLEPGALPAPNSAYMNVPNLKAGKAPNYHVLLNADHYWDGKPSNDLSASFTMGPQSTFCHSTDENGNVGAMVDVRVTQDHLPLFFPLLNIKPSISAHARVGIQGVGQETNISPFAVRDAGLTPCVTVNLRRTDNNQLAHPPVNLSVNQAATAAANGPIVWDNGLPTSVNVPSGTNLYAQTVLHAQGADGTCDTSSNPLTYDSSTGVLLLNSYDDPPTPPVTGYLDPNSDPVGGKSEWSKNPAGPGFSLLDDGLRQGVPPNPVTNTDQITSTAPAGNNINQSQDMGFTAPTWTWSASDTYKLWVYGNTSGENKREIDYAISTNGGAYVVGANPIFPANTPSPPGNAWRSVDISSSITSTNDLSTLKVRLIHINQGGNSSGTATVDAVYVERVPAGPPPQITGSSTSGGVTLIDTGLCAPDQYFTTSAANCGVEVCAIVWFTPGSSSPGVNMNGAAMSPSADPLCATNVPGASAWTKPFTITPKSGQHPFSFTYSEVAPSVCSGTCTGPLGNGPGAQQQAFAACDEGNPVNSCPDPNASGSIVLAEISDATTLGSGAFHSGSHNLTITVELQGLQDAKPNDPPTILKFSTSGEHQTGMIDCGQGNGAGVNAGKAALFYGCPKLGTAGCNNTPYCAPLIKSPDGSCNNALRTPAAPISVDCVNVNNGNTTSIVGCLAARIVIGGGGSGNNVCKSPNNPTCNTNYWPTQNIPAGDPRAVTMVITYPADLAAPNADVPIRTFATFYVTGWSLQGNAPDCGVYGAGNLGGNETIPSPTAGEIWGHWITYTDPNAGGNGQPCNFQAFGNCAAVLSR